MDIIFPTYEEFHTKIVFYRIPKNASTSIYDHLGNANLIHFHRNEVMEKVDQKIYRNAFDPSHLKADEFKNLVMGANLRNYFSFCVVRNPWDRAVSMYLHAIENDFKETYGIKEEVDFNFFCNYFKDRANDPYFIGTHKQTDWTVGQYPPTEILRFENINEEFAKMVEDHMIVTVGRYLPHKNKTKHTHYSNYYNSETKKIIGEIYEEDVDNFKYVFTHEDVDGQEPKESQGSLRI